MAQLGFFDLLDRYASLDAKRDPLVEIDAVVPWVPPVGLLAGCVVFGAAPAPCRVSCLLA